MVLMRCAHLPAAITSRQTTAALMSFVAGRRLRDAEHIGVHEAAQPVTCKICPITSTNACGTVIFGLWLASSSHACHLGSLLARLAN